SFLRVRGKANCIVTCRFGTFREKNLRLPLQAIEVKPLDRNTVLEYANSLGPTYSSFYKALQQNQEMVDLCTIPLMLRLATSVSKDRQGTEEIAKRLPDQDELIDLYFRTGWSKISLSFLKNIVALCGASARNEIQLEWINLRWPDHVKDSERRRR